MNLYIYLVLLLSLGHLSFGHSADMGGDLSARTAKILCDSGKELSLCVSIKKLVMASLQYDSALNIESEQWESLNQKLGESYKSEVDPYIKKVCEEETTQPMYDPLCGFLSVLEDARAKVNLIRQLLRSS